MSKSLDLGCGDQPRNPFHADEVYGVDVRDGLGGRIRRADLVVDPIPFDDDRFDYLTAHDFIEHLPRIVYAPERRYPFVELMNEVWRVLKPGGLFFSYTPAYPHVEAFRDPTHVNIITFETFVQYFAEPAPHGVIYGFEGAFEIGLNVWRGKHLVTVLRKVESPRTGPRPAPRGSRVSIALDARGDAAAAAATLEDLLAQSHHDLEIVALCPPDGLALPADARVRRLDPPRHAASLPQALNFALPALGGEYFLLARAGERCPAAWLAQHLAPMRERRADAVVPGPGGTTLELVRGDEACRRLAAEPFVAGGLFRMDLVRAVGFEEFASDAHRYSQRRALIACARVALVAAADAPRPPEPRPSSVDAPYTELRLMQLYQEQGLPGSSVRAQKSRALASLAELQQPAADGADAAGVQRTIDRFVARLALVQVFDPRPRPTPRERLRKLKQALRQRAERLRLAVEHR
ncbi:MAG TPA: class I SAM-dependent methyltransferase [Methylibium sp.]|uniref:class I SAM-dependent methyltransferase n=1 Tax=Methylibium sp. TaxID=2067992 RepID=UPI002DBE2814|nr:class I SAM-dependent methyltransferase [Methylibium sp.]HEU4458441.1 class I SAM-dependent methyltransferase [Methylibium sp.]